MIIVIIEPIQRPLHMGPGDERQKTLTAVQPESSASDGSSDKKREAAFVVRSRDGHRNTITHAKGPERAGDERELLQLLV